MKTKMKTFKMLLCALSLRTANLAALPVTTCGGEFLQIFFSVYFRIFSRMICRNIQYSDLQKYCMELHGGINSVLIQISINTGPMQSQRWNLEYLYCQRHIVCEKGKIFQYKASSWNHCKLCMVFLYKKSI